MKQTLLVIAIIATVMWGCKTTQTAATSSTSEGSTSDSIAATDSTEYELVIFDPDFDIWMNMHARPMSFYNQSYLENWNMQLVRQWNSFQASSGRSDCRPVTFLDYDAGTDYGMELNYRLFYYFRYMQERCRIFMSYPGEWR